MPSLNSRRFSATFTVLFLIMIITPIPFLNLSGNIKSVFAQESLPQEGGQSGGGEEQWTADIEFIQRYGNESQEDASNYYKESFTFEYTGSISFKTLPKSPDGSSGIIEGIFQGNVTARYILDERFITELGSLGQENNRRYCDQSADGPFSFPVNGFYDKTGHQNEYLLQYQVQLFIQPNLFTEGEQYVPRTQVPLQGSCYLEGDLTGSYEIQSPIGSVLTLGETMVFEKFVDGAVYERRTDDNNYIKVTLHGQQQSIYDYFP